MTNGDRRGPRRLVRPPAATIRWPDEGKCSWYNTASGTNKCGKLSRNPTPSGIALNWLLRLRWWVIGCQVLLVCAIILIFPLAVPLPILALILGFEIGSNIWLHYLERKKGAIQEGILILVMILDIILLTALLHATGGPMNPFTFLYLIHVALAAILMRQRWSAALAAFTTLAYATLFLLPPHDPVDHALSGLDALLAPCHGEANPEAALFGSQVSLHLQGMWVAFAITAFFIAFFVGRIHQALEEYRRTANDLREQKIKNEKLAALATLAAGAAHEFSTPLATIAVASGEMQHHLREAGVRSCIATDCCNARPDPTPELLEDLGLIREQVERCREILDQMTADAGEHRGEGISEFTVQEVIEQALATFSLDSRARIVVDNQAGDMAIRMPFRTLSRVIRGLVKNGLEASPESSLVTLNCRTEGERLLFSVSDQGSGMSPEVLQRAAEPFFTTKEPGKGMGLGLFLAKSAAERFGGGLEITSRPGEGTTVTLSLHRHHPQGTEGAWN